MMERRRFLAWVGAVAAGTGGGALFPRDASAAPESEKQTIWFLDPEHGAGKPECPIPHEGSQSCHGCNACHSHAESKLFSSLELADASRAHSNCKCLVDSIRVTRREFALFFGPSGGPLRREKFDKRTDQVFLPAQVLGGR